MSDRTEAGPTRALFGPVRLYIDRLRVSLFVPSREQCFAAGTSDSAEAPPR